MAISVAKEALERTERTAEASTMALEVLVVGLPVVVYMFDIDKKRVRTIVLHYCR